MKKFKFRLEKVRQYKEGEATRSKRELAKRISDLNQAEHIYEQLSVEKERSKLSNDNIMTAGDLVLLGEYEFFLQSLLVKQASVIEEAEKAVEIAREELLLKARDEKALSLLRERRFEEFREEVKKTEKKEIESLAIRQHTVRQEFDGE